MSCVVKNFDALNISKWLKVYEKACEHWFFGSCKIMLSYRYRRCVTCELSCKKYKQHTDDSEIANELILRAVTDYALLKTLWHELSQRKTHGDIKCLRHSDCRFRWKPKGSKIRVWCDHDIDTDLHFWGMLRLLTKYESWKQKLNLYQ